MLTHWTKVVNRADMPDRITDIFNVFYVCGSGRAEQSSVSLITAAHRTEDTTLIHFTTLVPFSFSVRIRCQHH